MRVPAVGVSARIFVGREDMHGPVAGAHGFNARRVPRYSARQNQATTRAKATAIAITSVSASHGCTKASASPPTTAVSSVTEAVQLLTGSGEVLSSMRVPVLS